LRKFVENQHNGDNKKFQDFYDTDIRMLQEKSDLNGKHIEDLFDKTNQLDTNVRSIGALDFHKMLNIANLGFEESPKKKHKGSPKKEKVETSPKLKVMKQGILSLMSRNE
jgi:hypothetical protein